MLFHTSIRLFCSYWTYQKWQNRWFVASLVFHLKCLEDIHTQLAMTMLDLLKYQNEVCWHDWYLRFVLSILPLLFGNSCWLEWVWIISSFRIDGLSQLLLDMEVQLDSCCPLDTFTCSSLHLHPNFWDHHQYWRLRQERLTFEMIRFWKG